MGAKSRKLDLILVNSKAKPPVCKLDTLKEVVQNMKKREEDRKKEEQKRKKGMKNILVGAAIDGHDLATKIRKVKEFIDEGLQVKLTIFAKKPLLRKNPLA